jgi:class I fructose-bisphosphate aldolase
MGAVAVGATIYFGSEQSRRQIEEISAAFERARAGDGDGAVGVPA